MSSVVEDVCELLDSYNGRDKVVRLACYTCKLYGCLRGEQAWQTAGSRLSGARLMLRLFDDIPMIRHTYNYGLGKHESTKIAAVLGVLANIVDQTFLPVEKACWLHEVGVLRLSAPAASRLEVLSTVLWAASLYISLIQTARAMRHTWWRRDCLRAGAARRQLDARLWLQGGAAAKLALDLVHAGSCLPRGWLWGARLAPAHVAAAASLSSLAGIALYFARKRLIK
ncbi:peroxisomal membrane protein 11C-like [Pararge aegeria]|uniref:Jg6105 protein n=2 Tax=Pararge aegeria TaxID=116150 RepID=A0A8S4RG71_9NEOP|nr:peroxisomal membrane protein 11C-like [Pararge aegeria]CAH2234428.1 jg6105 [Pararge aegeria aegeria]